MAQSNAPRVRTVKRHNPRATWDEGWLGPSLSWLRTTLARLAPTWYAMLHHWGGIAGMLGGFLWAVLFFVFFLDSYEISSSLGLIPFFNSVFYFVSPNYLLIPLALFFVAILGIYQSPKVRVSRLGKIGTALALLGLSLKFVLPPLAAWLDYLWLNAPIDGYFNGGWRDTPLSAWYYNAGVSIYLLPIGLVLIGIAALRTRAFPTAALLGLTICSCLMLVPLLGGIGVIVGRLALQLPYIDNYDYLSLLYYWGLFPLIAYLFGVSWIVLGYAVHIQARKQLSTEQNNPA